MNLSLNNPERTLHLILRLLELEKSDKFIAVLSAGALEDVLAFHGPAIIDQVESEAKMNPKLALALGGVWQNQMSDEIFSRVQLVRNRNGWDGN